MNKKRPRKCHTIKYTEMKTTTHSHVYKKLLMDSFYCDRCAPNRGCNNSRKDYENPSWKYNKKRKTQYRGILDTREFDARIKGRSWLDVEI